MGDISKKELHQTIVDTLDNAFLSTAPNKEFLADTDTIPLSDSADANAAKKVTFGNIKSSFLPFFQFTNGGFLHNTAINFNTLDANILYGVGLIGAGSTGAPPESYGVLEYVRPYNGGYAYQRYHAVATNTSYYRRQNDGVNWTGWGIDYGTTTITVSQTAPTSTLYEGFQHQVY